MNQELELELEQIKGPLATQPIIHQIVLPPVVNLPCIHHAQFAHLNGLSEGVVGGWVDAGYLPTIKIGRYTLINLVALTEQLKTGGVQ
jgi:hypothetical protein